ncbi:hypothetical protein Tco_0746973 [Tanacetum coccineum]
MAVQSIIRKPLDGKDFNTLSISKSESKQFEVSLRSVVDDIWIRIEYRQYLHTYNHNNAVSQIKNLSSIISLQLAQVNAKNLKTEGLIGIDNGTPNSDDETLISESPFHDSGHVVGNFDLTKTIVSAPKDVKDVENDKDSETIMSLGVSISWITQRVDMKHGEVIAIIVPSSGVNMGAQAKEAEVNHAEIFKCQPKLILKINGEMVAGLEEWEFRVLDSSKTKGEYKESVELVVAIRKKINKEYAFGMKALLKLDLNEHEAF